MKKISETEKSNRDLKMGLKLWLKNGGRFEKSAWNKTLVETKRGKTANGTKPARVYKDPLGHPPKEVFHNGWVTRLELLTANCKMMALNKCVLFEEAAAGWQGTHIVGNVTIWKSRNQTKKKNNHEMMTFLLITTSSRSKITHKDDQHWS